MPMSVADLQKTIDAAWEVRESVDSDTKGGVRKVIGASAFFPTFLQLKYPGSTRPHE